MIIEIQLTQNMTIDAEIYGERIHTVYVCVCALLANLLKFMRSQNDALRSNSAITLFRISARFFLCGRTGSSLSDGEPSTYWISRLYTFPFFRLFFVIASFRLVYFQNRTKINSIELNNAPKCSLSAAGTFTSEKSTFICRTLPINYYSEWFFALLLSLLCVLLWPGLVLRIHLLTTLWVASIDQTEILDAQNYYYYYYYND